MHDSNVICFIIQLQANLSLEGGLKRANQQGTIFALVKYPKKCIVISGK